MKLFFVPYLTDAGGPPGYMSIQFHTKMARSNYLYKLLVDGLIIGAALLFTDGDRLTIKCI